MFVTLGLSREPESGFVKKFVRRMRGADIHVESGEYLGRRFAHVLVDGPIDWHAVARICGPFANRVLLPEDISLPKEAPLQSPALPEFYNRVLLQTACSLVERTRMPMYRRVLGFVDLDGSYAEMLDTLLMHYTSVQVLTENIERYEACSRHLMEELGAPLTVCGTLRSLESCVLVVSPASVQLSEKANFSCPVLTGGTFSCGGRANLISGLEISGLEVKEACPPGISLHQFAGAMYEFYGIAPSTFSAVTMMYNQKSVDMGEAVEAVRRSAGLTSQNLAESGR